MAEFVRNAVTINITNMLRKKPQWRWPFSNPVGLVKLQKKLFGKNKTTSKFSWKLAGRIALWGLASVVLIVIFLFAWFAKDLPTPGKIRNLVSVSSTRLYDRNLQPLYTISGEKKRITIEAKDIPDSVKQATVAIEDKRFYKHPGVDIKGIFRSIFVDIVRKDKAQGGSTITQQFVRAAVLGDSKKTLVRKIKEAILAIELEALYSKDEILVMYLNEIPYGGNNYGIEAAARAFFGKPAKDLTLIEAATLAALPQAPTTLSPYGTKTDRLIARRNTTLDIMAELGNISTEQAAEAKKVELAVKPKGESITAPHFVLFVKDWLVEYFAKELGDRQLAEQKVEEGGYSVVTTLDLDKQKIAEEILTKSITSTLKKAGATNAGLVSIDPKRGEILSMVGSVDYFNKDFGAYNIATALRQPGSSFKPLVYAAAFKDKYNPATVLFDLRTDFGNYTPDNFDGGFRGPITIRQALGNSLNIPAVKTLALIGTDKALETAHDLGITTLNDKDRYGLSLVLGGGEVKLVDMATAYGVFANKGTLMPTTPILKITDGKGKEIYNHENPTDSRQVLDPQIAYQITNILSDTEAKKPVFGRLLNVLTIPGRPAASKTGTTNSNRDAWTIGFTPQISTAVWAGNNDNSSMNAGGSSVAAPIWAEYMRRIHEKLPIEQFERPPGIQEVTVDRLSNKLPVDGSEPIKDIFASWQVPTEQDNVHLRLRVCRENGLRADDNIPDELTETRTYTNIHSEMPTKPNWEGPVLAWAAANGLNNKPPTEKCTSDASTKPQVTITAPANQSTVSDTFTISANATAPSGIRSVEFSIDGISIGTTTNSPYETTYNSASLSNGSHTITATATSNAGSVNTDQISFTVNSDTAPPGNITAFKGVPGSAKVSLSWFDPDPTNPNNSDLKLIRIYVYINSTSLLIRTVEVTPGTQSVVVSGLARVGHKFTAKSVDDNSNESSGVSVVYTPL